MTGIACEDGLRLLATSRAGHWLLLKTTTQSLQRLEYMELATTS